MSLSNIRETQTHSTLLNSGGLKDITDGCRSNLKMETPSQVLMIWLYRSQCFLIKSTFKQIKNPCCLIVHLLGYNFVDQSARSFLEDQSVLIGVCSGFGPRRSILLYGAWPMRNIDLSFFRKDFLLPHKYTSPSVILKVEWPLSG
jgi:hypothetical protein